MSTLRVNNIKSRTGPTIFFPDNDLIISGVVTASSFSGPITGTATTATNVSGGIASVSSLTVSGISTLGIVTSGNIFSTGIVTAIGGFVGNLTGTATTAKKLENIRTFEIIGDIVTSPQNFDGTQNVSFASSIQPNTVGLGTHTYGDYVKNIIGTENEVKINIDSGEGVSPQIGLSTNVVISNNLTVSNNLQVYNDLNVNGNITIGGTTSYLIANDFIIKDRNIVIGFTTNSSGNEVSNDTTANSGGVAVASTEGSPLVDLTINGVETLPSTYKRLMWFKKDAFTGLNTDAWLFNYGVGIGTIEIPSEVRLAVGNVHIDDFNISKVKNISASGIVSSSSIRSGNINSIGIITALELSTGSGAIGITSNTIIGPSVIFIDPAAVGDNTGSVKIRGDLYVDGTQTIINSIELDINNLKIGIGVTTSDEIALDGAGIGIGSTSIQKTLTWDYNTSSLKSSENLNLSSGKSYKINGSGVLSSDTLGASVVNSSLTTVGILNQLNVSGVITSNDGFVGNLTGTATTAANLTNAANINSGIVSNSRLSGSYNIDISGNSNYSNSSGVSTNVSGGIASVSSLTVSGISTLGIVTSGNIFSTGIVTAIGGFNLGISSAGSVITSGPIKVLNFIGVGNTFNVNGTTVDISIQGGGGGSYWTKSISGIHTLSNVGIGTTIPATALDVLGDVNITGVVTAIDFNSLSDIQLKSNIQKIQNPVEKINQINGVRFIWNSTGSSSIGVIAQEVEKVFPELVNGENPKTVNYNGFIGVLIEVVKEQQKQIEELKNKIL